MTAEYVGKKAPDFTLKDQDGNDVSLSDFKGKNPVVLMFYPADETPGCTIQLCAARDDYELYEKAGVKVFGVNQGSEASHQSFIKRHKLKTPLLVDTGLQVATRYLAVMGFGPVKFINRTVVAIDPTGKIVFYKRGIPGTKEILASIQKETSNA